MTTTTEILVENLYDAVEKFRKVYTEVDFSGPLSAIIGADLYERLADDVSFYMEGAVFVGDALARGCLIPSRVHLVPCPDFLEEIRSATKILEESE